MARARAWARVRARTRVRARARARSRAMARFNFAHPLRTRDRRRPWTTLIVYSYFFHDGHS